MLPFTTKSVSILSIIYFALESFVSIEPKNNKFIIERYCPDTENTIGPVDFGLRVSRSACV